MQQRIQICEEYSDGQWDDGLKCVTTTSLFDHDPFYSIYLSIVEFLLKLSAFQICVWYPREAEWDFGEVVLAILCGISLFAQ